MVQTEPSCEMAAERKRFYSCICDVTNTGYNTQDTAFTACRYTNLLHYVLVPMSPPQFYHLQYEAMTN